MLQKYVLAKSLDVRGAASCVRQLRVELLPAQTSDLDLTDVYESLEAALRDRSSILAESAAKPGASASSIVRELIAESQRIAGSAKDSSGAPAAEPPPEESSVVSALTGARSSVFRGIVTQLGSLDLSTPDGQRDALAIGFEGNCVIAVRVLLSTAEMGDPLSARLPALGTLNELRQYRLSYFTYLLRVDPESGAVPVRMLQYDFGIAGKNEVLLHALLKFDFTPRDFIAPPHGLLAWKQTQDGNALPMFVDSRDYFCIPSLVKDFFAFLHILLIGMGCANDSKDGYTMLTLGEFFADHLEMAHKLDTHEQMIFWVSRGSKAVPYALITFLVSLGVS